MAAEGASPGPCRTGPSRLLVRPGPRGADLPRAAGVRGSGLGFGSWRPAGPSLTLELQKFIFMSLCCIFPSHLAVNACQRRIPLKLYVQQTFLEHLLRAGT